MTYVASAGDLLRSVQAIDTRAFAPVFDNAFPSSVADIPPPIILPTPPRLQRGRPRTTQPTTKRSYVQLVQPVREAIREEVSRGRTYSYLARLYRVSPNTISRIAKETHPPKRRGGSVRSVLTGPASLAMASAMLENPQITGAQLAVVAQAATGGRTPAVLLTLM